MVTIAHLARKIVQNSPFVEEALQRGLINYVALSQSLHPQIEKEMGKKVKLSAVTMALRRLAETLPQQLPKSIKVHFQETDMTIRSDLFEVTVAKSSGVIPKIGKLYSLIDFNRGDFLTMTQGFYEITLISNRKYKKRILEILEEERKIKCLENLSTLTIKIPLNAVDTIGIFYLLTKALAWEGISIIEIVSTFTELTFVLREDDVPRAFRTLKTLLEEN